MAHVNEEVELDDSELRNSGRFSKWKFPKKKQKNPYFTGEFLYSDCPASPENSVDKPLLESLDDGLDVAVVNHEENENSGRLNIDRRLLDTDPDIEDEDENDLSEMM